MYLDETLWYYLTFIYGFFFFEATGILKSEEIGSGQVAQ